MISVGALKRIDMNKKVMAPVIDSRHLKILAAKKDLLKDAIVFIRLNDQRYGEYDMAAMRKLAEEINNIEPTAWYCISVKDYDVDIYDVNEFKNKDLLVTVSHRLPTEADKANIEAEFSKALQVAKNITFVHTSVKIEKR